MKIQDKITFTIALTLFIIIFITAFVFTQLFVINNRNTELLNLSQLNYKFTGFIENNFNNIQSAVGLLTGSDYIKRFENIIGVNIIIADSDLNIIINPINLESKDLRNLMSSSREIKKIINFSGLLPPSIRNTYGKIISAEINNKKYYVSIQEFSIKNNNFLSIFIKQESDIAIPPLRYLFDLIVIFLIAGLVSIITGFLLSKNITGPILRLNRSVSRISNGDYSENIKVKGNDEISILARNINVMKDKIQRSQESLKEFTYILSHEIKNMITSINGYAVGISEGIYSTQEEINEALNIIKGKTKDLENITESLLMLSKIENKIIDVSKEEIDIESIVDDLIKLYEPDLAKSRLKINKSYNLPEQLKVKSDKYLVQTVISNLINNAIKYSSVNSNIDIEINTDDKNVIFSVSNKGFEISEDEKDKIFNMFYRSKKYDFKNIKGFGLGLAISKKIAVILSSNLDFALKDNTNTFTFKIPLI